MKGNLSPRLLGLVAAIFCMLAPAFSQNKTVSGKVTDAKDGSGISGVSVTIKGTNLGTQTDATGAFSLSAPANATTLVVSAIGFRTMEVAIGAGSVAVALETQANNLNEVVVVGYGTARKRDLTGSVAQVKAKDFNQGIQIAPDQLIQGKVAGVQVLNNSGQPGGATTIRIRGNASIRTGNQPLIVVDGVPLDGRSARPGLNADGIGATPDANPLNFINPNDIATMDVLKDASATAIYGSRGANGVIMITTKRGQSGAPKVDVNVSGGVSNLLKKLEVLTATQFRGALTYYGVAPLNNDWFDNVDAMDAITRTAGYQNYNVAIGGGNETGRYRLSLGYMDQRGIVLKTGLKKYTANLSGGFKFLESKRIGLDFSIITTQTDEDIAPIANNTGFEGSLIGQALQWNPTRGLRNKDGSLNIKGGNFPNSNFNPLATSEAYDDNAKTSTVLASINPWWKITNELEYRMILSTNYSTGIRRSQWANWINLQNIEGRGWAQYGNNELSTQQMTHLLNYNKDLSKDLSMSATAGFEYMKFNNKGMSFSGRDFPSNYIDYTDYLQASTVNSRSVGSFSDPLSELQSFFGRLNFNYKDLYLLTGTFRADGSSKFGKNNRYGYFPSFSAAWNVHNESFMKDNNLFTNLKVRAGWGMTGNQEFPAGAATERYRYNGPGSVTNVNIENPDLKWETSTMTNIGIDFSMLKNKLFGTVDYFNKNTKDLLYRLTAVSPAPEAFYWTNLPGKILNSGLELSLNYEILRKNDLVVTLGGNIAFLKNELTNFPSNLLIQTGEINGQGLTGARAQRLANGQPLSVFWMGKYLGLNSAGEAQYAGGDPNNPANRVYAGSPNPKQVFGLTLAANYKKFAFSANMNGASGHYVYNNTTQAALAVGNIKNNRNIAYTVFSGKTKEDPANAQPVSDRYLEKGDYLRLANATLSYSLGNLGKGIKNASVYLTAQNLFIITKYSGFDPEVNTPKAVDEVPSFGIEYTPYPTARSFVFGINFSL